MQDEFTSSFMRLVKIRNEQLNKDLTNEDDVDNMSTSSDGIKATHQFS